MTVSSKKTFFKVRSEIEYIPDYYCTDEGCTEPQWTSQATVFRTDEKTIITLYFRDADSAKDCNDYIRDLLNHDIEESDLKCYIALGSKVDSIIQKIRNKYCHSFVISSTRTLENI
jgi:hypothetical protein